MKAGEIVPFTTKNLHLEALCVKVYPNGALLFCQDRLIIIDSKGEMIEKIDIIDLVEQIM